MKYINTFSTYCFISVIFLSAILFTGCGSSSVVINPDYNSPVFKKNILNGKSKIIKAIDKRTSERNNNVGIAQVGLFNKKVPYNLNVPVSDFVEKAADKVLCNDSKDSLFVPVTIIIDTLEVYEMETAFSEKGYCDCYLSFLYPYAKDSVKVVKTKSNKSSSGLDVTNSLERLIYEGVTDCSNQFALAYNSNGNKYFVSSDQAKEIKIDSSFSNTNNAPKDSLHAKKRDYTTNLGIAYVAGDKIVNGFQLTYQMYDTMKASRQLQGGFGYSLSFYNIENRSSYIKGSFLSFNYRYSIRYALSPSATGLYFGGSIRLSFGSENIKYGSETKTNYFIGPTLEEILGLSIADKVFLEGGFFQIKHFGSDLLPDDIGYSLGINFRL